MARNAPFTFDRPLTVGDLQQILDRWIANKQGRNAQVVIECVEDVGHIHALTGASILYGEGTRNLYLYVEEGASVIERPRAVMYPRSSDHLVIA